MANWQLYTGSGEPRNVVLPPAPPWRRFTGSFGDRPPLLYDDAHAVSVFQATPEVVDAVNAALHLRRPLLLTGTPGSGKSSLIDSVARELRLGRVLRWNVTSRSTLQGALYSYDAIGRMHARAIHGHEPPITDFLTLGPLGTALLPWPRPRALLIDEIDKSDIDLPNDLLHVFERGEFEIPELARLRTSTRVPLYERQGEAEIRNGMVHCREFPFVVLTSNGERDFPPAFLRRCIRLTMPALTEALLTRIVTAHLGPAAARQCSARITEFATAAAQGDVVATDQLMNAVYLVTGGPASPDESVIRLLLKQLTTDQP